MQITYHANNFGTKHKKIDGKVFIMPDDDTVRIGMFLKYEGKSYSVFMCDLSIIYDDDELNEKHGIIRK